MKSVSRLLLTGAGAAVALALAAAPASAAAEVTAAPASVASQACTWEITETTVSGSCSITTPLGPITSSFEGTLQADNTASGALAVDAGRLGSFDGSWHGGPFVSGETATIHYTATSPLGTTSGEFEFVVP
ncbi:hypothetical protein [Actinophytocola oryzae]|uniref:Uncharacterized protein n=1 Tax=Actinophytocola oryzae TaxID=502181 RepID=A0A4R7URV0_9PSEU|nr:hypothetical protein [Actinophytocola oryzae]TDV37778.1 hypothetical protein CLV71_12842 [Actinophytocola oryzae]